MQKLSSSSNPDPRVLKTVNGWKFYRSTIPGNYNLTHEKTGVRSGKIAGMAEAEQFAREHPHGNIHCVTKIGSKIFPKVTK